MFDFLFFLNRYNFLTYISAMPSHNAGFCYDDEEESQFLPNEEEVYQDLVKLQSSISKNQVKFYFLMSFSDILSLLFSFSIKNLTKMLILNQFQRTSSNTISLGQRDYVIRELIETEINYNTVLSDLKFKFMQPLEKLLKEETLVIFPRIKELVEVHSHFLDRLRESTEPNSNLKLSSVFLEFREQFLIYGDYCSRMTEATDTLKEVCKRSPAIDQLVNVSFN